LLESSKAKTYLKNKEKEELVFLMVFLGKDKDENFWENTQR
jgi:hypothetical protein